MDALELADLAQNFRFAMRKLAATVTVVTTHHDGEHHGMAATAVTSLSVNPASLLVCVNQSASMHDVVHRRQFFCVNLLGQQHAALCEAFGGKLSGAERFRIGEWAEDASGLRYLTDAQANLFCRLEQNHVYGTHTIFIGRVERVILAEVGEPLLYQAGSIGHFTAN
jgi:flavin reductase (DIM6/NTAB) family NADH-FMN oxidoreductase RutF